MAHFKRDKKKKKGKIERTVGNINNDPTFKPETLVNTSRIRVVDLPSKFKLYGDCEIYYDTYSYEYVKFLSSSNLPRHVRNKLILDGIHTSFDKNDLTYMDFIHIAFLRKLSSLNSAEFTFDYTCNCSKHKIKKKFGIMDLESENLKADFPVTVDFFSIEPISFKPITVGIFNRLLEDGKLDTTIPSSDIIIIDDIAIIAGCTDDYDKYYDIIKGINNKDDQDLLDLLEPMLEHGLEPFKFKCSNRVTVGINPEDKKEVYEVCGQKHQVELQGGELLIYPFRESSNNLADRISFGK